MSTIIKALFSLLLFTASIASANHGYNQAAEDAYIYAYPLVMSGVTMASMTNVAQPGINGNARAPINQFVHLKAFPDADARKDVIRPNVDTLYSTAWLDLSKQPMVLILPDSHGRYYLMQMLDAWTNVFASPGKRTTGTKAGKYAITGPNWHGHLPAGVKRISAPTNLVWIIGRTQTNGVADYVAVNRFQNEIRLIPLNELNNRNYKPAEGIIKVFDDKTPPPVLLEKMDGRTFFTTFTELLKTNPPQASDRQMKAKLKQLGIVPGQDLVVTTLNAQQLNAFDQGKKRGLQKIAKALKKGKDTENGWVIQRHDIGRYGNNYLMRAAVARWALGANIPEDAIYPSLEVDSDNNPLQGSNRYVLHFAKNRLPPVNAFWSVTLYDAEGYFVPNNLKRYALGDRDELIYNKDGSLDIYLQHDSPGADKERNWLPTPSGQFNLLLRLYWPEHRVAAGQWAPPAVKKLS